MNFPLLTPHRSSQTQYTSVLVLEGQRACQSTYRTLLPSHSTKHAYWTWLCLLGCRLPLLERLPRVEHWLSTHRYVHPGAKRQVSCVQRGPLEVCAQHVTCRWSKTAKMASQSGWKDTIVGTNNGHVQLSTERRERCVSSRCSVLESPGLLQALNSSESEEMHHSFLAVKQSHWGHAAPCRVIYTCVHTVLTLCSHCALPPRT